jgi:hypothetical protein
MDFAWYNALENYENIEKFMEAINKHSTKLGFKLIYSTP